MQPTGAILFLSLQIASVASLVLNKADDAISARLTEELQSGELLRRNGLSGHPNSRQTDESYSSTTWSGAVAGDGERKFESVSGKLATGAH